VCGAIQTVRIVRGIPKKASAAERSTNRRAASARLRVVERIVPTRKSDGQPVPPDDERTPVEERGGTR
jgi:16S rRNA (cytosine1402-N4)-methyltransferase